MWSHAVGIVVDVWGRKGQGPRNSRRVHLAPTRRKIQSTRADVLGARGGVLVLAMS